MLAKTENQNGTIVGCSEWGLASSIYVCHRAAVFTAALLALLYVALWTTLGIAVATVAVPPAIGLPHWHLVRAGSPIAEPYPALHGGSFSGPKVKLSPDPLVSYRWRHPRAGSGLQTYVLRPVAIRTQTPQSFSGLKSVTGSHCYITVKGTGSFCVDFGTESAAWIEFDSPDFSGGKVEMGVSEYNAPAHDGRQLPKGGYDLALGVTIPGGESIAAVACSWLRPRNHAGKGSNKAWSLLLPKLRYCAREIAAALEPTTADA